MILVPVLNSVIKHSDFNNGMYIPDINSCCIELSNVGTKVIKIVEDDLGIIYSYDGIDYRSLSDYKNYVYGISGDYYGSYNNENMLLVTKRHGVCLFWYNGKGICSQGGNIVIPLVLINDTGTAQPVLRVNEDYYFGSDIDKITFMRGFL